MCRGCNPTCAFSYVGGLLVNSSFVFLISWGTAVFWPIGFAIAVLYTAGLFAVGTYLRKRESPVPAINLLYLVGVVGVGASGMILAYNVTGCNSRSGSSSSSTSQDWVFDAVASNASTDVVAWAGLSRWRSDRSDATYAFVPSTGATYFRGRNGTSSHSEYLIRASAGVPPVLVSDAITSPSYLHLVGEPSSHLCFVGWSTSPISGVYNCDSRVYCCSIGTDCALSLAAVAPLAATAEPCNPTDLLVDAAGVLWLKTNAPFGVSSSSGVVYRVGPPFTSASLASRPVSASYPPPPPPSTPGAAPSSSSASGGCNSEHAFRMMALAALLLATLPSLGTALWLWWKLSIPSMAFAAFALLSAVVLNSYALADPRGTHAYDVIKWWFALFGFVWLVGAAAVKLAERADDETIAWAINAGSIAYFAAVHAITQVPFSATAFGWVVYNVVLTLPMLALAVVVAGVSAGLPLLLASAGILIDTYKVTNEIVALLGDPTIQLFVRFLVLATVGVGIVALGVLYPRYQAPLAEWVDAMASLVCVRCRRRSLIDGAPKTRNDDKEAAMSDGRRVTPDGGAALVTQGL